MDLQKEKARASQHYMGWREGQHPCFFRSQENSFFLTLPFIERRYRKREILNVWLGDAFDWDLPDSPYPLPQTIPSIVLRSFFLPTHMSV
jgi:hypothetical protein